MRLVYQNAQRVIVWLGPSNSQIDCLFDWMTTLDQQVLKIARPHTLSTWENQWLWVIWHLRGQYPPDIREALRILLRHQWFSRIWVLQEAALAKSAVITCGRNEVNSRVFVVMPSLLNIDCDENEQSRLDILPGLLRAKSWWGGGSSNNLITLLQKFGRSRASDPRDIIYALLGLSGDAHSSEILRPNYQISLQVAIQQSVAYFLMQTRDLPKHTPIQLLPEWDIGVLLTSLSDLALNVFRWATYTAQDELLYHLLISQKGKHDQQLLRRYMEVSGRHGPPIMVAMKNENLALIELLLEFPDVNLLTQDSDGNSPLSIAVGQGNTVVANLIWETRQRERQRLDLDVDFQPWVATNEGTVGFSRSLFRQVHGEVPLFTAIRQGDQVTVERILEEQNHSELNYLVDASGDGLLNVALRSGDEFIVRLLLDNDIDYYGHQMRLRGSDGLTPFESALVAGSPAIIERFLAGNGRVVHDAVGANQFEFLRKIFDLRPDLANYSGGNLRTPLAAATWAGNTKTVSLLLDKGADINVGGSQRLFATPLWIAASNNDLKTARLLVERGANLELMAKEFPAEGAFDFDNLGPRNVPQSGRVSAKTWAKPIWVAASLGYTEMVSYLITQGADMEARDSYYGMTPLWRAAHQDKPEVMRVLIEGGADIRAKPVK